MAMREMSGAAMHWGVQTLWEQLSPVLPGLSIEVLEQVESTNTELLARLRSVGAAASNGGPGRRAVDLQPTMLVAAHQTRGRGRSGRAWVSSRGGSLTFSLALALAREDLAGLSLAVGVALAEALDPAGAHLKLKWPNDLWLVQPDGRPEAALPPPPEGDERAHERKLGGILIETMSVGSRRMVVIGIGLNVLAQKLTEADAEPAHWAEIEPAATPPDVLARIALPLAGALREFDRHGFSAFVDRYSARDLLRGRMLVTTDPACGQGVAAGVDHDGALVLDGPEGARHRIIGGPVSVRPLAAAQAAVAAGGSAEAVASAASAPPASSPPQ
jgi:BirA family transcriptional regulator, biotin operon repressor / biotin---[acetyl-CoA-carboxylase] ligase